MSYCVASADETTITFFTSDNGPWLITRLSGGSSGLFRDGKTTTWEGGVREPAVVRWPTKIVPGVSREIGTTCDIFPTAIALAGGKLPLSADQIDGKDLSPVLFQNGKSPHRCVFIYKGTPGLGCPATHPNCPGLWAIRCGPYKLHHVTSNYVTPFIIEFHDPPLMYDVETDPSEAYPLDHNGSEYQTALAEILAAQAAHEATLRPQTNEMAKGVDPALKVCGCPNSQQQHPNLPNCTCNPENFEVFVCGPVFESVCRANARDSSDTIQQQCGPFKANDARTWPIQPSFTLQPS